MCDVNPVDIASLIVASVSLIVAGFSFFVACKTLMVTKVTLKWFMDDREIQDEKEFKNEIIFKNIQDISVYILYIAKVRSAVEYISLKEIEKAQKNLVVGRTYIEIYANTHNLPYLKTFCDVGDNSKHDTFMNSFFSMNEVFINYCYKHRKDKRIDFTILDNFQEAFRRHLQLAMDYSISVLYRKTENEKDSFVIAYGNELKSLIDFCKAKKLFDKEK